MIERHKIDTIRLIFIHPWMMTDYTYIQGRYFFVTEIKIFSPSPFNFFAALCPDSRISERRFLVNCRFSRKSASDEPYTVGIDQFNQGGVGKTVDKTIQIIFFSLSCL